MDGGRCYLAAGGNWVVPDTWKREGAGSSELDAVDGRGSGVGVAKPFVAQRDRDWGEGRGKEEKVRSRDSSGSRVVLGKTRDWKQLCCKKRMGKAREASNQSFLAESTLGRYPGRMLQLLLQP